MDALYQAELWRRLSKVEGAAAHIDKLLEFFRHSFGTKDDGGEY